MYVYSAALGNLLFQWTGEQFWQEGVARGTVLTCKSLGLDAQETARQLRSLLPDLSQEEAQRLVRYHWKEHTEDDTVARVEQEICQRTEQGMRRLHYGPEYSAAYDEGYLQGRVKALALAIQKGADLDTDFLQEQADEMKLPLSELMDRIHKRMDQPDEET